MLSRNNTSEYVQVRYSKDIQLPLAIMNAKNHDLKAPFTIF